MHQQHDGRQTRSPSHRSRLHFFLISSNGKFYENHRSQQTGGGHWVLFINIVSILKGHNILGKKNLHGRLDVVLAQKIIVK